MPSLCTLGGSRHSQAVPCRRPDRWTLDRRTVLPASRGRGRGLREAGPTAAPWRSAQRLPEQCPGLLLLH
jgi:hypothetical protein